MNQECKKKVQTKMRQPGTWVLKNCRCLSAACTPVQLMCVFFHKLIVIIVDVTINEVRLLVQKIWEIDRKYLSLPKKTNK